MCACVRVYVCVCVCVCVVFSFRVSVRVIACACENSWCYEQQGNCDWPVVVGDRAWSRRILIVWVVVSSHLCSCLCLFFPFHSLLFMWVPEGVFQQTKWNPISTLTGADTANNCSPNTKTCPAWWSGKPHPTHPLRPLLLLDWTALPTLSLPQRTMSRPIQPSRSFAMACLSSTRVLEMLFVSLCFPFCFLFFFFFGFIKLRVSSHCFLTLFADSSHSALQKALNDYVDTLPTKIVSSFSPLYFCILFYLLVFNNYSNFTSPGG